jgi:hypothetical protein
MASAAAPLRLPPPRSPLRNRPRRSTRASVPSKAKVEWVADLLAHNVPQATAPDYLVDAIEAVAAESAAADTLIGELSATTPYLTGGAAAAAAAEPYNDGDDDALTARPDQGMNSPPPVSPLGVDVDMMDVEDEAEAFDWIPSPVSSPVSEPNSVEEAERARTMIVLDFDDTLFPTTELRRRGYATTVQERLPDDVLAEIERIEEQAVRLVEQCSLYGNVVLLTNAEGRWLRLSTSSYMPRLERQLQRCTRTVYGRHFSGSCPDDPGKWKELAFRDNLQTLRQELGNDRPIRLVSVGDSTFERQAAKDAGAASTEYGKVEVKTVKMMDLPSFSLLQRQLEVLCLALTPILEQRGTLDVEVACNDAGGEDAEPADDGGGDEQLAPEVQDGDVGEASYGDGLECL